MKLDLAVIGQGAVSPAGIGVFALRKNHPVPELTPEVRRPAVKWPVLRFDLKSPELQRWQREPRLRRSSPITLFLIEAAEQALAGVSPEDRARTGLIIAYSTGCLLYSRRFFQGMIREGRNLASPALFPETVFNSPGSHVASALKLNGAVYALVGDETAWLAALTTAALWLRRERVSQVLVLGADEFDPLTLDAYNSARWLSISKTCFLPSEGAGALLVRPATPGNNRIITALHDGYIYRTPRQAASAAENLFRSLDPKLPIVPTAQGTWLAATEEKMLQNRSLICTKDAPRLGHAFTASAAWNILRGLDQLSAQTPVLNLPLWGLNQQLGALELSISP